MNWGGFGKSGCYFIESAPPTSTQRPLGGPGEGWVVSSRVNRCGEKAQRGSENSQRETAAKPAKVCPLRCQLRCRASVG